MANDIKHDVRHYLEENFIMGTRSELKDDSSFIDLGIIDSTGVLELIAFIEGKFGIRIEDVEMVPENLDSLINIERFVNGKLSQPVT